MYTPEDKVPSNGRDVMCKFIKEMFWTGVVVAIFTCPAPVSASEAEYDSMYSLQALNMAMMSLYRIVHLEDRVVLDQEYEAILSNFSYGNVANDPAVVGVFREIMKTITEAKLNGDEAAFLQKTYDRKLNEALKDSLSGGGGIPGVLSTTLMSFGNSYFSYQRSRGSYASDLDRSLRQLKKDKARSINELRTTLVDAFWGVLRKYGLSDSLRLTEKTIEALLDAVDDPDIDRSLRKFERIRDAFEAYPPFWCYYGRTAQTKGDAKLALVCYGRFEALHREILRKDPFLAEVCKGKILLSDSASKDEIRHYLGVILENSLPEDWVNLTFAALQYRALGDAARAQELLQQNVDNGYDVRLNAYMLERIRAGDADLSRSVADYFGEKDPGYAFEVVRNRAEQGDPQEQNHLGMLYLGGRGVKQSVREAALWYDRSAKQDYVWGEYNLGLLYARGQGVRKDRDEAEKYFKRAFPEMQSAAEAGNPDAQYALGNMYYRGYGVERNYGTAVRWFEKSAAQDRVAAQYALGMAYQEGRGVSKDKKKAKEWLQKAAEHGSREAKKELDPDWWTPAYWWPW